LFSLPRGAKLYPRSKVVDYDAGNVLLAFTVNRDGTTKDVSVLCGKVADFEASAKQALEKCRFMPAVKEGVPVEAKESVLYDFALRTIEEPTRLRGK
jgi:TonB family protein